MAIKFGTNLDLQSNQLLNARLHLVTAETYNASENESKEGRIIMDNGTTEYDKVKVFCKTGTSQNGDATYAWRWLLDSRILDSSNKILLKYLPDTVLGQMMFGGTTSGTPDESGLLKVYVSTSLESRLTASGGTILVDDQEKKYIKIHGEEPSMAQSEGKYGYGQLESVYFIIGTAITSFYDETTDFQTGDWLVSTGEAWVKIDNSDAITSVRGEYADESEAHTGPAVVLTFSEIVGKDSLNQEIAPKLKGIANGISKLDGESIYTLSASYIRQDSTHRFVTDAEKAVWDTLPAVENVLSNAISANTSRLDGVEHLANYINEEVLGIGKRTSYIESLLITSDGAPKTLWGQSLSGTGDISGDMTGVGNITISGITYANGGIVLPSGKWIESTAGGNGLFQNTDGTNIVIGTASGVITARGTNLVANGGVTAYASNSQVAGTILEQIPVDTDVFDVSTGVLRTKSGGVGTITKVTAGDGLYGGGESGEVTLQLSPASQTAIGKAHEHSNKTILDSITSTQLDKLNGIDEGAQVNVIETIKLNNSALTPSSKTVNINACTAITVPSELNAKSLSNGTIAIEYATGYSIPTTANQTAWSAKAKAYSHELEYGNLVEGNRKSYQITNSAGTKNVAVTLYDQSDNSVILTDIVVTDSNITVSFGSERSSTDKYRLVYVG